MAKVNEQELLKSRIIDSCVLVNNKQIPKFIGFLSEEEVLFANKVLLNQGANYTFFSGTNNGMRKYLGIFPDGNFDYSIFPISALKVEYSQKFILKHSDFLGALMALNLTRSSFGDFIVLSGEAYLVVADSVKEIIKDELHKVGRVGVKVTECDFSFIPYTEQCFDELRVTVSSLRIDCVVSALCGISREKALGKIKEGSVKLNAEVIVKPDKGVLENSIITVRGYGKYKLSDSSTMTKKGKTVLKVLKYK